MDAYHDHIVAARLPCWRPRPLLISCVARADSNNLLTIVIIVVRCFTATALAASGGRGAPWLRTSKKCAWLSECGLQYVLIFY